MRLLCTLLVATATLLACANANPLAVESAVGQASTVTTPDVSHGEDSNVLGHGPDASEERKLPSGAVSTLAKSTSVNEKAWYRKVLWRVFHKINGKAYRAPRAKNPPRIRPVYLD